MMRQRADISNPDYAFVACACPLILLESLYRLWYRIEHFVRPGEKLIEYLKIWLEPQSLLNTDKGWETGQDIEIAAGILDLFHLLPNPAVTLLESAQVFPPTGQHWLWVDRLPRYRPVILLLCVQPLSALLLVAIGFALARLCVDPSVRKYTCSTTRKSDIIWQAAVPVGPTLVTKLCSNLQLQFAMLVRLILSAFVIRNGHQSPI